MDAIKGKTSTGFEFTVNPDVMDDMELIDAIADTIDSNPLAFSTVCTKLLGAEQKKALYNHLRSESGRVTVESVSEAISDIFKALGDAGKNS